MASAMVPAPASTMLSAAGVVILAALMLAPPAAATPWWVAWEGDDFPENEGWTRTVAGQPSQRTLEDGVMTLDSLGTTGGWDGYQLMRSGGRDPGPGETFVLRWRMRVEAVEGWAWDPGLGVLSDSAWYVSFLFSIDRIWSPYEYVILSFAPGVFHAWELRSSDMRNYELYLDGALIRQGYLVRSVDPAWVASWGDSVLGPRSRSSWDYVHLGVVPECSTSGLVAVLGLMAARVRRL
ncbi:MAG: hypothetical protein IPM13_08105 [Phycisphaerales bacterium]|nr:hypothetical protein [Phycisphaerales bacterium]